MILAALGAVVVFVSVLSYVGQVRERVGDKRTVLQLTQKVKINEPVTKGMLKPVKVPKRWIPGTMIGDYEEKVSGKVAAYNLPQGAYLQQGMLKQPPRLEPGQREIAIMINAETGVAGKIQPGEWVDIYATFPANEKHPACSVRALSSVQVIDVGEFESKSTDSGGETTVVPITFALPGNESLDLTYLESFAKTVSLARVGGAGPSRTPLSNKVCSIPVADRDNGGGGEQATQDARSRQNSGDRSTGGRGNGRGDGG